MIKIFTGFWHNMSVFKKLKHLLKPTNKKNLSATSAQKSETNHEDFAHLNPISRFFENWIKDNGWNYSHIAPDEDDDARLNVFFINFSSDEFDWKMVIQILEKPQLITVFGSLDDSIPPTHRLSTLALLNERIRYLYFGDIELDLATGEMRSKLYFDAEFSRLNEKVLNVQMSQLFRLTEICHNIRQQALQASPITTFDELLNIAKEQREDTTADFNHGIEVENDDGQIFYTPSNKQH